MKGIVKSAVVVGKFIGLLVGNNFTTPVTRVFDRYTSMVIF
jgi:hypothetical protein